MSEGESWGTATVNLRISGERFQARFRVPSGPTLPVRLLPAFQALADSIVGIAVERVEREGERISCKKGCGACCRQVVPVSHTEARHLRELIDALPEPRREIVQKRFDSASRRVRESGLLPSLESLGTLSAEQRRRIGLDYFRLAIPCPFLEDEACSIHADRPISCREYLVTSPPADCANPSAETVRRVEVAGAVSSALAGLDRSPSRRSAGWLPLTLAPAWAREHPEG
ncbi:MAG: YkgJ family cysteine cluster protein, partial [Thermoanaerobaculia bacterium]